MKALIRKDLITLWAYCRSYFLICGCFLAAGVFVDEYDFLRIYPLIFMGMLPTTLIAYDERDRFDKFSLTMPLSRRQVVTARYLTSALLQGSVFLLSAMVIALHGLLRGQFHWEAYLTELALLLILGVAAPSLMLPFVFKLGSEKGRIGYAVTLGVILGVGVFASLTMQRLDLTITGSPAVFSIAILVIALLCYPASWALSVHWYEKREF